MVSLSGPPSHCFGRSVFLSLGVVSLLALLEGLILLPQLQRRYWPEAQIAILDCAAGETPGSAVCLMRNFREFGSGGLRPFVAVQSTAESRPVIRELWADLAPQAMALLPNSRIALCQDDGTLRLGNLSRPHDVPTILGRHGDGYSSAMAATGDGRWLVTLTAESLNGWRVAERRLCWRLADDPASSFALAGDSRHVVYGVSSGQVVKADVEHGTQRRTTQAHRGPVVGVATNRDCSRVASWGADARLVMSDLTSGQTLWSHELPLSKTLRFSPDGKTLVTVAPCHATQINLLLVWDVETGRRLATLEPPGEAITGACFASAERLYGWDLSGRLLVWDAKTWRLVHVCRGAPQQRWSFL